MLVFDANILIHGGGRSDILEGRLRAHIYCEMIESCAIFFGAFGESVSPFQGVLRGLLRRPGAKHHGFAEIAQALECGVRCAGVFVHLLQEKIEERFGKFVGIRGVATGVFINGFLAPGIEFSGVEHVGVGEENLRSGDDDANRRPCHRVQGPDGNRVISVWPEESDAL